MGTVVEVAEFHIYFAQHLRACKKLRSGKEEQITMYEWKNSTGRLSTPTVQTPAKLGATAEGPGIIYPSGTTFPKEALRGRGNFSEVPGFLAQKMQMFQKANSVPVHLKGGPLDKVLFGATLVMCTVGLTGCLSFFYDMSFPKKSED